MDVKDNHQGKLESHLFFFYTVYLYIIWHLLFIIYFNMYIYIIFIFMLGTTQDTRQLYKPLWSWEAIKIHLNTSPSLLPVACFRLWQLKLSLTVVSLFLFQAERCSSDPHDQQPYTVSSLPPSERSAPPCSCHVWLFPPVSDICHRACVTGSITPASDQVKNKCLLKDRGDSSSELICLLYRRSSSFAYCIGEAER